MKQKIQAYQYVTSSKRFDAFNISNRIKDSPFIIYHSAKKIK